MRTYDEIAHAIERAVYANDADKLNVLGTEMQAFGTPQAEALALLAFGTAARQHGEYASALESFRRAHDIYDSIGDRSGATRATGGLGNVYHNMGDNALAVEHYRRALGVYTELGDRVGMARSMSNMGNVFYNTGDYPAALEHYGAALATYVELGDAVITARITINIGNVYVVTGDYPAALEHFQRALPMLEELSDRFSVALVTANIGGVYMSTGDHTLAMEYYVRALSMSEELGDRVNVAICAGNIGNVYSEMGDHASALESYTKALSIGKELGDNALVAHITGTCCSVYMKMGRYDEAEACLESLSTLQLASPVIRSGYKANLGALAQHRGDLDAARDHVMEALEIATMAGLRAEAVRYHDQLRELAKQRNDFAAYIEHNNEFTRITEEINGKNTATKLAMQAKQREIDAREREHAKLLAVLHSTLPKHIADRVARGEVVNDHHELATVIFLDIVGFTERSATMSSQEVVALLEQVFSKCDEICAHHGVTKIKTIGDSYMCVAFGSVIDAARCAIEMNQIEYRIESRESIGNVLEFRIGMHCGPVTAGVIGKERMQYDVWGDTVNVASRMESAGLPGRVHVTEAIVNAIENQAIENSEFGIEERGEIDVKGKGLMRTYWLEGRA